MGGKGSGGHNRKPTKLHILRGKKVKDRESKHETATILQPPDFLDDEAKREWFRLVPALTAQRVLTDADRAAFAAYCVAWSDFQRATAMVREHGDLVETENGIAASPFVKMKRDSEAAMVRWGQCFGLNPQSRAQLVAPAPEQDDELSQLRRKWGKA